MKYFAFLILMLSLSFCKSIQIQEPVKYENETQKEGNIIKEKIEIIPHQIIHVTKDEAGMEYVKLLPGDKTVFRYSFRQKPDDNTLMDALLVQNILFELPEKIKNTNLKDEELKSVNLTAQILGFRNARLIKIDKGSLKIKIIDKQNMEVQIDLDDSYSMLPKKHIKQSISLKK